jgi:hypothetical protein
MVLLKMHVTTGQNFNARPYGKMFFKFSLLKPLSHLKVYLVDVSGLLSYTMFYHVFIDQELKMFTIKEKSIRRKIIKHFLPSGHVLKFLFCCGGHF